MLLLLLLGRVLKQRSDEVGRGREEMARTGGLKKNSRTMVTWAMHEWNSRASGGVEAHWESCIGRVLRLMGMAH